MAAQLNIGSPCEFAMSGLSRLCFLFAVGMVNKPAQEPAPEFQIQQEEFPALPSTQISECMLHFSYFSNLKLLYNAIQPLHKYIRYIFNGCIAI